MPYKTVKTKEKPYLMLIIPSLGNGGSERVFSYIVNCIDHTKFTIELIVIDSSNIKYPINPEIKIHKLGCKKISQSLFKIVSLIRKKRPDILFSTLTHLNIMVTMIKPFLGKQLCLVGRESTIISKNILYESYPSILNFLIKKFYKKFDLIVCQSNDMMNDLINNYDLNKSKIHIINNPIGFPKPTIVSAKNKNVTLLTVGRVEKVKGYDRILISLKDIKEDFSYVIIGDGNFLSEIKMSVEKYGLSEKVIFMGAVDNAIPFYQNADVYLHGSYYEGFPNVLLEAAANGIPIVAYNSPGGIDEIVIDGLNGILVDDNNQRQFRDAIIKSMKLKFDRHIIQTDIYNRYNQKKIIHLYEQMFISIYEKKFGDVNRS